MNTIQQTLTHWEHVLPFTHIPRNETEYEKLLLLVDQLMELLRHKKDVRATSLLKMISQNIAAYEARRYPTKTLSPIEMLEYLMEEHQLQQSDLPEIGSQSLVSKILKGERKLTLEHVRALAKRFSVSPAVFVE